MARISKFIPVRTQSEPHPTEVEVLHQVIETGDEPLLQITTYGSKFRETRPKPSQTLQFDKESARQMIDILEGAFPDLRQRRVVPHGSEGLG